MEPNQYANKHLKPIIEPLFLSIISSQPEDVISFSLEWLRKRAGITNEGLTQQETEELIKLRKESFDKDSDNDNDSGSGDSTEDVPLSPPKSFLIKRKGICGEINNNCTKTPFTPKIYNKTEEKRLSIRSSLTNSFLFNTLEGNELNIIIEAMKEKCYHKDEMIIQQGDFGDCLYLIDNGQLKCHKTFSTGEEKLVKVYDKGEIFGELSLLYNSPRAAKVIVSSQKANLWILDRETFSHIVKESAIAKRKRYEKFLNDVEIFSTMDLYEISQICDALIKLTFNKDEYVIHEGEISDYFYIIEDGEAQATQLIENGNKIIVKEYQTGDYFGELALIRNTPRAANIIAKVII